MENLNNTPAVVAPKASFLAKSKQALNEHSLKIAVGIGAAIMTTPAFAAMDVDTVVQEIKDLDTPINKIGAAILGIAVILFGWRVVRGAIR